MLRFNASAALAGLPFSGEECIAVRLVPPAIADVPGDLGGAYDLAGGIADGRHRQRDVDAVPVLVLADRLEVIDALSRANPREHVLFFRPPVLSG